MQHTHVVICGLPRSGSTMLYAMMRASGEREHYFEREMRAITVIDENKSVVTKRPSDVFEIDNILSENADRKVLKFILTVRDPRSALVSRHSAYPHQYF